MFTSPIRTFLKLRTLNYPIEPWRVQFIDVFCDIWDSCVYFIVSLFSCFRYGGDYQYALGINVPPRYCEQDAPLDQNFLPRDNNAQGVKRAMAGTDKIYKGVQLIGARPKPIPHSQNNNYHSEYLLLINSMSSRLGPNPLMETLLDSNPDGCAVFFTRNSPCVKTCSTPNGLYSIIPALRRQFQNHKGLKAFVFNRVWPRDENDPAWRNNIKTINDIIPVYRCDGHCTLCVNNNDVDRCCLKNYPHC